MPDKGPSDEPDDASRHQQDPFIERLRPDPAQPVPPVLVLAGLLGLSDRAGYQRLYFSRSLDNYAEFPSDAVLFVERVPADEPPHKGLDSSKVTLRRDAPLAFTRLRSARPLDEFDLDARFGPAGVSGGQTLPLEPVTGFPCVPTQFPCDTGGCTGPGCDTADCDTPTQVACRTAAGFGCGTQTCIACQTDVGLTCPNCDPTRVGATCQGRTCDTCGTCDTRCGTCATQCGTCNTCNTCATQCGTCNTCNTCNTQCNTCDTRCGTCDTRCGGTCNPHACATQAAVC